MCFTELPQILIFLLFSGDDEKLCVTTGGPASGHLCELPFKFNGVLHNECTWDQGNGEPWCSTLLGQDDEGQDDESQDEVRRDYREGGGWGICGPDCPIPPNPDNATYIGVIFIGILLQCYCDFRY